jgi:hypothetical protein
MHANGTSDDKRERPVPSADRCMAVEPGKGRMKGIHEPAHAMDFVYSPTLMEHVVDFLERFYPTPQGLQ